MIEMNCFLVPALIIVLNSEVTQSQVSEETSTPEKASVNDQSIEFSLEFKIWNASLKKAKIIPDVLSTEVPHPLKVVYYDEDVNFGNSLEYHRFETPPIDLDWLPHENDSYTAIMTDPDFPDPKSPNKKEYLLWMVTNIKHALVKEGTTIAQYVPPASKHTGETSYITWRGTHRIAFVVYKQPSGSFNLQPGLYTSPRQHDHAGVIPYNRENFSSKDFTKEHNLVPYAASYCNVVLKSV